MKACFNRGMTKDQAIQILGGTPSAAAKAIGITSQAVSDWPDVLSQRITDRVEIALIRMNKTKGRAVKSSPSAEQNKVIV